MTTCPACGQTVPHLRGRGKARAWLPFWPYGTDGRVCDTCAAQCRLAAEAASTLTPAEQETVAALTGSWHGTPMQLIDTARTI